MKDCGNRLDVQNKGATISDALIECTECIIRMLPPLPPAGGWIASCLTLNDLGVMMADSDQSRAAGTGHIVERPQATTSKQVPNDIMCISLFI